MGRMKKKIGKKSLILLLFSAWTVIGFIVLVLAGKLIPMPFAEFGALIYGGFIAGRNFSSALMVIGVILSLGSMVYLSTGKKEWKLPFSIYLTAFAGADSLIHQYVFLMSAGYVWKYLICAVLDIVIIISLFIKEEERKHE